MFRRIRNLLNYENNLIPAQLLVSFYNAHYKDKIKLKDIIGKNPEAPKIKKKKPASVKEIKAAFMKIFPMSEEEQKRDNERVILKKKSNGNS